MRIYTNVARESIDKKSNKSYNSLYSVANSEPNADLEAFSECINGNGKRKKCYIEHMEPCDKNSNRHEDVNKMRNRSNKPSNSIITSKTDLSHSKSNSKLGKSKVPPFISEEDYFGRLREETLNDEEFKFLDLLGENISVNENVVQPSTNSHHNETINTIPNSTNAEQSSERPDSPKPIFSRHRKKKKYSDDSKHTGRRTRNGSNSGQKNIDLKSRKSHELDNKPNQISDENSSNQTKPNVNNSESGCQNCCHLLVPVYSKVCYCSPSKYKENKDFKDFNFFGEVIPDKTPPIKPKKRNKVKRILDTICGKTAHGYESDENDEDESNQSYWNLLNPLNWKILKQFDPVPLTSYVFPHSTTTFNESYSSLYGNFINNLKDNNYHHHNNQYGPLPITNSTQYTQFPQKSIRLLVLYIAFDCKPRQLNFNIFHSKGCHPIIRHFRYPSIDGDSAFRFVYDSIINCWANSWKVALVVSNNPTSEYRELFYFFDNIRKVFESEILDIILLRPSFPTYYNYLNRLEVNVLNYNEETYKQKFSETMDNVVLKVIDQTLYFHFKI
jgi:hypothetical protein